MVIASATYNYIHCTALTDPTNRTLSDIMMMVYIPKSQMRKGQQYTKKVRKKIWGIDSIHLMS
jgi:hypothetical protein